MHSGRGGYDSDEELEDITADLDQSITSLTDSLLPRSGEPFATSSSVPTGALSNPATPVQLGGAASKASKSEPATPVSNTSLGIAERVVIFENLIGARQKTSSPLAKKSLFNKRRSPFSKDKFTLALSKKLADTAQTSVKCTRSSIKKGLTSPLTPARDLTHRRKRQARVVLSPIVNMALADISGAGRLNPRTRPNPGAGADLADRGFAVLATADIPIAGRNVLRSFLLLRTVIATDANLLLTPDGEVAVCQVSIEGYIEQIVENRKNFEKVLETIGLQVIANAESVMDDICTLEWELRELLKYCKIKKVGRPAQVAGIAGIRAERLKFPRFDGSGNFKIFKENWKALGNGLASDEERRMQLKQSFDGKAQSYLDSQIKAGTTYQELWTMLDERFDDPAAVNYNLLNNLFNSPKLSESKSTQEHWDIAVGDVQAVLDSGLTMDQVLIYYRIQNFPKETVQRIKDLHRMSYPAGRNITLSEAKSVLNKLTSEDALLTQDCISMEETFQSMTLTATPRVVQPPKHSLPTVPQSTSLAQPVKREQAQVSHGAAVGKSGGWNGKGSRNNTGYPSAKTQPKQDYCHICDSNDHLSYLCPKFGTPSDRRAELSRVNKCPECGYKLDKYHRCPFLRCKHCGKPHRTWLCKEPKTNASTKGDSYPNP